MRSTVLALMKTIPSLKMLMIPCVVALASCAMPPTTKRLPVSASIRPASSLSEKVFQQVNAYRRSHGAADLERHSGLDQLAQKHCEYLRDHRGQYGIYGKYVSHVGFEGRSLIARERYQMMSFSENVVAASGGGSNMASTLVQLWAGSKDHEYNMRSDWSHTGVGLVVDKDGMIFSTQLFATVSNFQMATRNRFNSF